jgi:hypothetical protein
MAIFDPVVMPLAYELLGCLEEEIAKVLKPPKYVGLRPGTNVDFLLSTTEDECCEGLAWVRPALFYPSSARFPLQDEEPSVPFIGSWAITLEMGAVRCAPTPNETKIPTVAQWNEVVQAVMDDAAAMRRALCCFIDADPVNRKRSTLAQQWQPLDVEGGCVGGTLQIIVRGPACDCSEAGGS